MPNIVRYTLAQTVFLNVLFVLLVVAGVFSLLTTPTENMPLVDIGKVFIHTVYYGATAEDVEQLVTREIEEALEDMEEVEWVQSHSYRNFSSVQVKLIDDSDYRDLYDELRFRVLNIKNELPAGADDSTFIYADTNIWMPVLIVHLGGDLPLRSLERYADDLRAALLSVPDVRDINIEGEPVDEFHLSLDPNQLRRYGVTFAQVVQAVETAGVKIPTGRFRTGDTAFMLDAGQRMRTQQDVLEVIVRRDGDGNYIRVGDLTTSARLHYRDRITIPSVNGRTAIRLMVTKEERGDSVDISRRVKEKALQFGRRHAAQGLEVLFTNDSTIEINDSINVLGGNLIMGMGLVTLVLWLTLGFRNAMLTAVGIPFSFLGTMVIMKITGVTINTISLFSFVLLTGIIVDDAIVITENCFRHMQMGKARSRAIIDGTSEVMLPVISSMLTTVLAFLPMLIMTGSTGDFFAVIPKTVTYALAVSLLEALFMLPAHIYEWGPKYSGPLLKGGDAEDAFSHLRSGVLARMWTLYQRMVVWALDHKKILFIGINAAFFSAIAILLLSMLGILPLIKVKFFPGNYFRYHVTMQTSAGTSIERTDGMVREISSYIMSLGTGQAQSSAGYAGFYEDQDYVRHFGPNFGQVVVTLPEKGERAFPENPGNDPMLHLNYMRERIKAYVAQTYAGDPAAPKVQVFEESDGPPTGKPVNIRVQANTMDEAIAASDRMLAFMRGEPELKDLVDLGDDRPALYRTVRFEPRQEAVYQYNLTSAQITGLVAGVLNGRYAGLFRTADEEVDLLVRMARTDDPAGDGVSGLKTPMDVLDVPAIEDSAAPVYLRDLVTARQVREPNVRSRYQGKPTITISADIRPGSNLSSAVVSKKAQQYSPQLAAELPGVAVAFGGEFESTSKSFISLGVAFAIALLGIYMVLASQFRDYVQPLLILTAVPFALIGVVYGIFLTRTIFTITSFIATVGLSGVAVNNTILMIDFMNKRKRSGKSMRESVIEACAARMRPVLLTTVTTLLGLLPMAIGIPSKSISWAPMATAFVTGLCSSTVLALLVTPANYELLDQIRVRWRSRNFRRLRRKAEARRKMAN
jgi:HAE1 family hydrophobic/amphiphilic exporter-1